MLIGYARVSTQDQTSRIPSQGLDESRLQKIFKDEISGSRAERPGLAKAQERDRNQLDCSVRRDGNSATPPLPQGRSALARAPAGGNRRRSRCRWTAGSGRPRSRQAHPLPEVLPSPREAFL